MVIENQYIQTNLMVALILFEVIQGGGLFINQRQTLPVDSVSPWRKFFLGGLIVIICRVYASKWFFRKFYGYFLFFLANVGTRGLRTWFGRCCCCFGDLC